MRTLIPVLTCAVALTSGVLPAGAQDYGVYRDPPRIALTQQRLRLLQREIERQSLRWEAFDTLMSGGANMPEPGFAWSLYFRVAKDDAGGRRAIDWALGQGTDLRQLALVYDWCGPLLTPEESERLAAKIQPALQTQPTDIAGHSVRVLAAVAIADRLPDHGAAILGEAVRYWRDHPDVPREQLYALFEMLHAIRDNTQEDLRDDARDYFVKLPLDYLAGHYPAPLPAAENEYRIPVYVADGPPDVRAATLSRAAGLAMVAYDTNSENNQYVQGWLMIDRFLLRSPLGIPYEFLWANPYQPGLSYQTLPLVFHDDATGNMFARTSWDDEATWLGYFDGRLQMFQNGGVQTLRQGAEIAPVRVGDATVAGAGSPDTAKLTVDTPSLFVLGLAAKAEYGIEIDDQELALGETDAGGTLRIDVPEGVEAGVRVKRRRLE